MINATTNLKSNFLMTIWPTPSWCLLGNSNKLNQLYEDDIHMLEK